MLQTRLRKAAQDRLGLCRPQPQRSRILDHLVVLLGDEVPVDGPRENKLEIGVGLWFSRLWSIEALGIDVFESRHQLKAQEPTESKGDLILTMRIDELLFDLHLGTMPQH